MCIECSPAENHRHECPIPIHSRDPNDPKFKAFDPAILEELLAKPLKYEDNHPNPSFLNPSKLGADPFQRYKGEIVVPPQ